ncbi:MAG: N-acetyltransferase [Flavobacteriales bacterium]
MVHINIRPIGLADLSQLQLLGRNTFAETFADGNTVENMEHYLRTEFTGEKLTAELTNAESRFYFAETDRKVTGYLKVNFGRAQTDLRDERAVEIERVYVLKAWHGQGVGQALYAKALTFAKEAGAPYMWLGVWEHNARAIAFYRKNGFVEFDKHLFTLGSDEQTDILMRLELRT